MYIGTAPNPPQTSKRAIAFVLVIVVHVVLIYALNAGLSDIIRDKVLGNIQTVDIQPTKEDEDKPPPPPPKLETAPPPFVPPPDINIESPPVDNSSAIQVVTQKKPVEAPPPVVHRAVSVPPRADTRHGGFTKPDYPRREQLAAHEGTVYLDVTVLENGRVGDARIKTSSGFPALDEAAVAEVKRNWRFLPGTEDGKPIQMTVTVPIVFKMTN